MRQALLALSTHLDMAIARLVHGIERPDLIATGVPIDMEVVTLALADEGLTEPLDDRLIRAALERPRLGLVVCVR